MSALASSTWRQFRDAAAAEMPFPATREEIPMRRKLIAVRDTLVVLALQAVFRATQALRSLNY
jgi:hypothetical protein